MHTNTHSAQIFHIFLCFFASTSPSVSTPNFQKSTPFENLALTFFSVPPPYFRQNKHKHLYFNHLAKPLKIRLFSAKKFLAQNFRKFEGVECSLWEQIRKKINKNSETALVVLSCGEELKKKGCPSCSDCLLTKRNMAIFVMYIDVRVNF